jgi:hypothetical protein
MVCSSFGEHYTMPVKNAIRRTDTQILGLVPDIAFSPAIQNQLGHNPTKIANVLTATNMANQ